MRLGNSRQGGKWGPKSVFKSSNETGNFPHSTVARLWDENTRLLPYVPTVYTADAPAAAPASHEEGTRCQHAKPRQTNTSHLLSLRRTVIHPPPVPPHLPPIVTRSVFLPLRPPFSGLDGHYCRGEVTFIHGHDRRPSPWKGVGRTGKENKHTSWGS